jgi:hypothetical protein
VLSCSSKNKPLISPDTYLKLNNAHFEKHKLCQEQQKKILIPPISESDNPDLDDENYYFLRDEKKALTYIEKINISHFTLKENQLEYEAMIKGCVTNRDQKHTTCETLLPAFKFFRGLIHGMNQYKWSKTTINKGRDITLSYIKYVAHSDSSIMDVLFANDLLMRLSDRKYIPTHIRNLSIELRKTGEVAFKDLKEKIAKMGKKELTCADANEFYSEERLKVRELSKELTRIVESIPKT